MPEHEKKINEKRNEVKKDLLSLFRSVKKFLYEIFNLREGADIEGTVDGIKRDIAFKGPSLWILVASIFIASIGLNQNSIPVVIGAMLISPLMGPILGIGLAVGTFDWDTLKRSLKFFSVAIFVSILTSTIYFMLTPLKEARSELLARTQPILLDVFVAIFGGLAGIIAGSRKEKTNVVPGVAIATALMPPLCTAGYGLATLNFSYFFGAFYLFFINSFFISITTFIVVRYLDFPQVNFVSKIREKKIKRYMIIFVLIVILPSAKIFWDVIQESRFNYRADEFINEVFKKNRNEIFYTKIIYSDTVSTIDIYLNEKKFSDAQIADIQDKMTEYGLYSTKGFGVNVTDTTVLTIHQGKQNLDSLTNKMDVMSKKMKKELQVEFLKEFYKNQEEKLLNKNERIEYLENQIIKFKKEVIPLKQISEEIKIQFTNVEKLAFARSIEFNNDKIDTIPVFLVLWDKKISSRTSSKNEKKMSEWLKVRLEFDTVRVVKYK